jgi:oligopeptide/dipeptide ABC transporter ATP-binding protein
MSLHCRRSAFSSISNPVLDVRDLRVDAKSNGIVRGVSFALERGQRLGIVGESGCGKTMTALSIMGLTRRPVRVSGGEVRLGNLDLLRLNRRQLDRIRGNRISMIYQDPAASLNPLMSVGNQIAETIRLHRHIERASAREQAVELLGRVGVLAPRQRFGAYPHEFSGGMRQRVMIAIALAGRPEVLLCDEPTSALDVTTQVRIMALLDDLCREDGVAMVLITHDLAIAFDACDDVAVMYAGQIVERAPTRPLYTTPRHPYTTALLAAVIDLDMELGRRIPAIPGQPPSPGAIPSGCAFRDRCPIAIEQCASIEPELSEVEDTLVRCIRAVPDVSSGATVGEIGPDRVRLSGSTVEQT